MSRIPSTPSRKFNIRTLGLFKKGNTLFNLLHPRVAIIVQPENSMEVGNTRAYASHNDQEWPELHEFLTKAGIRTVGPDHFDTVADRLGEHSSSSVPSGTPPRMTSSESGQSDERLMLERHSPEPRRGTPFPSLPPFLPNPTVAEPLHLPRASHSESALGLEPHSSSSVSCQEQKMRAPSREIARPHDEAQHTKKRKAIPDVHGVEDHHRRKRSSRSQGLRYC